MKRHYNYNTRRRYKQKTTILQITSLDTNHFAKFNISRREVRSQHKIRSEGPPLPNSWIKTHMKVFKDKCHDQTKSILEQANQTYMYRLIQTYSDLKDTKTSIARRVSALWAIISDKLMYQNPWEFHNTQGVWYKV